jgi:hypothetical protein
MIAKPRPRLLEKKDRRAAIAATDKAENAKVKARSGGQCEVVTLAKVPERNATLGRWRCPLRASHVHHLISGIGRRNVGKSITAEAKLHVCERCHELIHGHVLKPVNATEREAAATVRYERVL